MKHDFQLIGGSGDWEVYECRACLRTEIPSPFGFMWSDLLWRVHRRWRCPGARGDDYVINEEAA